MQSFAIPTLFLLLSFGAFPSVEVTQLLNHYIIWTQTGASNLAQVIFTEQVDLTYQHEAGKCTSTPFHEYVIKIENAARSVSRTMVVKHVDHSDNKATAYLSDDSKAGDFSLTHRLQLRKRQKEWKIYAIKILDDPN